jgi:hypothetical protein
MESVGPCAALEQEVSRLRHHLQTLIAGGVIALPLLVSAHGTEFIDASVEITACGHVHLRLIADHAENPMIADEGEARRVLPVALEAVVDGHRIALAPLKITQIKERDPRSPMPTSPDDAAQPHALLAAEWTGPVHGETLQLIVPTTSQQTVLLWEVPSTGEAPRWTMLIPGDAGPIIRLPHPVSRAWCCVLALVLIACGCFTKLA